MKKLSIPIILFLFAASLSANAFPPPEKGKMLLTELEQKRFDYDGKVVEVEVTYARSIEQKSPDQYTVSCYCYNNASYVGEKRVSFSKDDDGDALEFFQDLSEKSYGSGLTSFYVLVDGKSFIAVGEKYRKSKDSYSW